jgi:hypothetical protein
MAIHGVTPAFVRGMRDAGYEGLPVDKLIALKIHGVTPDTARAINATVASR